MDTQEETSLKGLFQKLAPTSMSVIRGKVISSQPLRIQAINDEKLVLNENTLCLPSHLSNYTVKVNIQQEGFSAFAATMTVFNALKDNEKVYLLSFNNGKKYYVLDREV